MEWKKRNTIWENSYYKKPTNFQNITCSAGPTIPKPIHL